jgi:hypothetical protein
VISVETIPGMRRGQNEDRSGGEKFNYNVFDIL